MTALSSGNLYQPLKVGSGHLERLDNIMWPTYRRVSLEIGGDHYAEFVIDASAHDVSPAQLERWFTTWIGCHFVESYAGRDVFQGFVSKLTLYIGGVMRTITLDNMFNHVRVAYQPDSNSPAAITSAASNAASVARYGTKQAILETRELTKQTHAETVRDNYLDRWKRPRSYSSGVRPNDSLPALEVYVSGYVHTLGWVYYNQDSESASDTTISAHLTSDLITGLDFVSAGSIATVSTSITDEADWVTYLQRIDSLMDGLDYRYGCYAGRRFDVKALDYTTIKYRRKAYSQRQGFLSGGIYVPEPLISPSGWVYTDDIFAGRPTDSDLKDDPRADWVASVEYSIDGVELLNGEEPDDAYSLDSIKLALALEAGESFKKPPEWWQNEAKDALKG